MEIKINILKDKTDLDIVQSINALPGLISFIVLLCSKLISGTDWFFIAALSATGAGVFLIYFPFYLNARVTINEEGLIIRHKSEDFISWDCISKVTFESNQTDFNHNYYKCNLLLKDGISKSFYITRYLFSSKEEQKRRFLGYLSDIPSAKIKI
jgi:hypothetical protein